MDKQIVITNANIKDLSKITSLTMVSDIQMIKYRPIKLNHNWVESKTIERMDTTFNSISPSNIFWIDQ